MPQHARQVVRVLTVHNGPWNFDPGSARVAMKLLLLTETTPKTNTKGQNLITRAHTPTHTHTHTHTHTRVVILPL